jgi:hypothetical protein
MSKPLPAGTPSGFKQLFVGRDEPILDPDIPIIDAHHHLFTRPGLRYLLDDYLADARSGHKIVATVYMEIHAFARPDGPELLRPLGEIEFANGLGAMCASGNYGDVRVCAGIISHADLRVGDRIAELLDRAFAACARWPATTRRKPSTSGSPTRRRAPCTRVRDSGLPCASSSSAG